MLRTTQGSITVLIGPNGIVGVNNNYVGVHILADFLICNIWYMNENSMKKRPGRTKLAFLGPNGPTVIGKTKGKLVITRHYDCHLKERGSKGQGW